MKAKKKQLVGSVKVQPTTLERAKEICRKKGFRISFYADQALQEKNIKEAK